MRLSGGTIDLMGSGSPISSVLEHVQNAWGIDVGSRPPERLADGQESTVVRVGDVVVRIGPRWRSSAEAEWCYSLADLLGCACDEVVRPFRTSTGAATRRIEDRPVSVWPHVTGARGDLDDPGQFQQAAIVLARLHAAAAELDLPTRPPMSATTNPIPALDDPRLDAWIADFKHDRPQHALHGDYYPANLLFCENRLVGVIDWDEASIDTPEVELAMAACEWGELLRTGTLDRAIDFVDTYIDHGGTSQPLDEASVSQLYRARLAWELAYEEHHTGPPEHLDAEARAYRQRQLELYHDLRAP